MITIEYINESGFDCKMVLHQPELNHHTWYSSKRGPDGKYEAHRVSLFGAMMNRLKKCTKIKVIQS